MSKVKKMALAKPKRINKKRLAILEVLPSQVRISAEVFFKVEVGRMKPGTYGECHLFERLIKINQNQTPDQATSTLWHECIHAAMGVAGLTELLEENLGEALTICLENTFAHIVDVKKLGN